MLASLLPGVRDLRAPLVAGYTWLVTLWLALAPVVPAPDWARGVAADVYSLARDAGRPATLAAASVAAYLGGVLSVAVSSRLLLSPLLASRRPGAPAPSRHRPSRVGLTMLREAVLDQLEERIRQRPEDLQAQLMQASTVADGDGDPSDPFRRRRLLAACVDVEWYQAALAGDLALLPRRLLGEEKERELYSEFDRKKAEAEFRAGVALPAAVLVVVLGVRASPWWALALALPVLLLVDARRSERSAGDVLAEAVRARQPQTPALTELRGQPLQFRSPEEQARRIAADFGSPASHRALARLLLEHGDVPGARAELAQAVEQGDGAAMRELAELAVRLGRGDEATGWYRRAADAGDAEAMTALAERLLQADAREAQAWLARASDLDHGAAALALGRLIEDGNPDEALQLFRKAERLGVLEARREIAGILWRRGDPEASLYLDEPPDAAR